MTCEAVVTDYSLAAVGYVAEEDCSDYAFPYNDNNDMQQVKSKRCSIIIGDALSQTQVDI
jgi:hypothetical protein